MASYLPVGNMGLPFPSRLSRLYNDTKKSSDFVEEPVKNEDDPEIKALHRKLRIQKDRLVSWGLEWSDPNHSAEIDESLSKAGIGEVVGSIMTTVKDILDEAESLWLSYNRSNAPKMSKSSKASKAPVDVKTPIILWDKTRFGDLVHDLTASIDTLHDLSRTRSTGIIAATKPATPLNDNCQFESSRIQTPQELDPKTLANATTMEQTPLILGNGTRDVVVMSKTAYSRIPHNLHPWAPLLLEYADFNPIFAATGIMPSMERFEKLCAGLQMESPRQPGSWNGLPHLVGFLEETQQARLGLVYQFPATFSPVTQSSGMQNTCSLFTLSDILARPDWAPTLEVKFRLANNLANTVFDMHARGITHGNLCDQSVLFCNSDGTNEIDLRKPVVSGFSLFSDPPYENERRTSSTLFWHPLDPQVTPLSPLAENGKDNKILDLYSLAMLLLSIATWSSLDNLAPNPSAPSISESILPQIAVQCGTLYMKAVQACWNAVEDELGGGASGDMVAKKVQVAVSRYLEACCILDSVSGLEDRVRADLGEPGSRVMAPPPSGPSEELSLVTPAFDPVTPLVSPKREDKPLPPIPQEGNLSQPETELLRQHASERPPDMKREVTAAKKSAAGPKTRLYPNVPMPDDVIEQWNTIIMPQVNAALRSFFKKNPESVEISLSSVGTSAQSTQPTVLVVCSSVPKVRAILKKKLGGLFDGSTQFGLKVCRGQLLRSRKRTAAGASGPQRSMAGSKVSFCESAASSQSFQPKPRRGASIGAWIGDKHLPPVSFGGTILVDDKPYGMTVHHMLDDLDQDALQQPNPILRSIGGWDEYSESFSSGSDEYTCEFSSDEDEDELDESDLTSDCDSDSDGDESDENEFEPGDMPGVEPGCGEGYIVTQPAIDDVEDNFFASEETADEEHLDSFTLGAVYASSGIRRREEHGLLHEMDWALFEFNAERLPDDDNDVPRDGIRPLNPDTEGGDTEPRPTSVAPTCSLPGMEVQCMARSSGLQVGTILPALASVKIYGRTSPSQSYQVCRSSMPPSATAVASHTSPATESGSAEAHPPPYDHPLESRSYPMGVPGDSGAWVVDRFHGRLCGHVLAWSERKKLSYICPMDVLLLDIAETLDAGTVKLPGGEVVVRTEAGGRAQVRTQAQARARAGAELLRPELPIEDGDLADLLEQEEQVTAGGVSSGLAEKLGMVCPTDRLKMEQEMGLLGSQIEQQEIKKTRIDAPGQEVADLSHEVDKMSVSGRGDNPSIIRSEKPAV